MAQVFQPSANLFPRILLAGGLLLAAATLFSLFTLAECPYVTGEGRAPEQPVPFSHRIHSGTVGIDCRHCHTTAETSAFAGMPPTKTCVNCHSQIYADSEVLEPVRSSYREDRSIEWVRVADLPDFVYFDHSIHVVKGFACVTCHGRVDEMPRVWNAVSFQMGWCVECHENPERFVRPRERVADMSWTPEEDQQTLGERLVQEYGIRRATDCSACHR